MNNYKKSIMVAYIKQSAVYMVAVAAFFGVLAVAPSSVLAWHCVDMTATPEVIDQGESSTLAWQFFEGPEDDPDTITVTIDQLPGEEWPGLTGSTSVSPTETTTYIARATMASTSDYYECSATVTVRPPEEPKVPACPFTASDDTIVVEFNSAGDKNWDTTLFSNGAGPYELVSNTALLAGTYNVYTASWDGYADRIYSEQFNEKWDTEVRDGNGDVLASVGPTTELDDFVVETMEKDTFTDAFTLTEDGTAVAVVHHVYPDNSSPNSVVPICVAFERQEEPDEPWCELSADPTSIYDGDSSTISWDSYLVSSVDITEIGTGLDVLGSSLVSPATTTTYVGTFYTTDGSDPLTCEATLTVRHHTDEPELACTMSASPTKDTKGYTSVITWTSDEAVTAVIDNGIGSVALNGNKSVIVNDKTTYTGTFTDADGNSVTCSATVAVKTGGGSCLNCDDDDDDDDDDNDPNPTIILGKTITKSGGTITLDQVPYTGFEAGPLLTVTFWTGVFALSVLIAYFATRYQVAERIRMVFAHTENEQDKGTRVVEMMAPVASQVTHVSATAISQNSHEPSEIEEMSHGENILLSPEAFRLIQATLIASGEGVATFMSHLIEKAKAEYPREDGWILLSKERAELLLSEQGTAEAQVSVANTEPVAQATARTEDAEEEEVQRPFRVEPKAMKETLTHRNGTSQPVADMPRPQAPAHREQAERAPKKNNNGSPSQNLVAAFLDYLVLVKKKEAFDLMRSITTRGVDVAAFITLVVRELDEVYKDRIEGNRTPNEDLVYKTASWSNEDFEKVLGILVECIDYSYSSNRIGTKIALAKAFEHFDSK